MLVGREDHRAATDVAVVDDVVEDVRSVIAASEVADIVDHRHVWLHVTRESVAELPIATRCRELLDQLRRRDEERVEAVRHRAIRDGNREVRLAASGFASRMTERPSVTKSGVSSEPTVVRRSGD
ncbi:MAG: hypothetical protein JWP87_4777 [Labilithrix sp.]|nr:hypothetical protein [Labilithrix sp.]